MSNTRVNLQPSCIIHRRAYRETSQLIDVFSLDYGRQGVVARGIRKNRSRWGGLLEPFQPLLLSWSGRGDLRTLTGVELEMSLPSPSGPHLRAAFYLNELILRLLPAGEPYPTLFRAYWGALDGFAKQDREEVVLRIFERDLLDSLGYALVTDHEIDSGQPIDPGTLYYYAPDTGPSRLATAGPPVSGRTLLAIESGIFRDELELAEAKGVMRTVLRLHLGNKPLGSRLLYSDPL